MARQPTSNDCEVAVIGAGPYGLSITAHLKARGIATHTFGEPMSFWQHKMPRGMKLRSPWRATDLSDPHKILSLAAYTNSCGVPRVQPFPIEDFIGYGSWFQSHAVPDLDRRDVGRVERAGNGFVLSTNDGDRISAKGVVIATGLENHQTCPRPFAFAPAALVSHTCEHNDLGGFAGKRIAVIGRGQSACETAALLSEAGARPEIICRGPIRWLGNGKHNEGWRNEVHSHLAALLEAPSAIGRFPLSWAVEVPIALRLMPSDMRDAFNAACLRAAAAGWLRARFTDVRVKSGLEVVEANERGEQMELLFHDGRRDAFDHVMLATGYKFDVANLKMLAPELRASIACRGGSPVLSPGFESSLPGLFFAGASAVSSFGPLMRFIAGTSSAGRGVTRGVLANRKSAWLSYKPAQYGVAT